MSEGSWRNLAELSIPSAPGNERLATRLVAQTVREEPLSRRRLERLKTAVAEAAMNAMEHGNHYQPDKPVLIQVLTSTRAVSVRVSDLGGLQPFPATEAPNLEAKLAGLQSPRGWGLFLIQRLVDEMRVTSSETQHTIELQMHLKSVRQPKAPQARPPD
jgi:anti-sigma regulatory factor (Ser/Thr protein kinase)